MAVAYKQKCARCKKNYVMITRRTGFPVCYDCQKEELKGVIKNKTMKRMFAIPESLYKENAFLRDIKVSYLRWGSLSEKQIEAFKKTVKSYKEQSKADKSK